MSLYDRIRKRMDDPAPTFDEIRRHYDREADWHDARRASMAEWERRVVAEIVRIARSR